MDNLTMPLDLIKLIFSYKTATDFFEICFQISKQNYDLAVKLFIYYKPIPNYEWVYVDEKTMNTKFNKPNIILYGPIQEFPELFISDIPLLKSIKFIGLNNLEIIGEKCLSGNKNLEYIDFDGLVNLISIKDNCVCANQNL